MLEDQTSPNYKPADSQIRIEHADMAQCEKYALPDNFILYNHNYVDRVGPELFVARVHNPGNCSAMVGKSERRLFPSGMYSSDNWRIRYNHASIYGRGSHVTMDPHISHLRLNMHSYVVAITPNKVECNCIYCGSNIQYTLEDFEEDSDKDVILSLRDMTPKNICWDEPWSKPRSATQRELDSMGFPIRYYTRKDKKIKLPSIEESKVAYLDHIYEGYMARIRCGKCPEGGQHVAMVHYADDGTRTYPISSYCIFCKEEWVGPPDGFEHTIYNAVSDTIYLDMECAGLEGKSGLSLEECRSCNRMYENLISKDGDITVEQARKRHAKAKSLGIF
ncbi:MAG: hypothetical protein F4246_03630 [Rhodothermaceae bacterium]|nr:hypothetical protein [Rhodothermaceae bacterium]MYD56088.1 hypothetical protein [Rhodothermaceae bacterium]